MALFGSRKGRAGQGSFATRTQGVSKSQRAARARAGHKKRASHLYTGGNPKKGTKTTYRKGRGHLF